MTVRRWRSSWRAAAAAIAVLLAVALAGCSRDAGQSSPAGEAVASGGPVDLRAVCPPKIVVQDAWWPSMSDGVLYALLGPDLAINAERKRVSAPLVSRGKDTGVRLEVRAGGPAMSFQQTSKLMYQDRSITLGKLAAFDEVLELSARQPTVAVFAALETDPQMIMWDPATYPQITSIRDIGKTDTTVLYFGGDTYMEYLVGSGILKKSQVDGSYDGSPARFVAAGGKVAQSGFAEHDPFIYQQIVEQWAKPVRYQLVAENGYPNYGSPLVIRQGDEQKLAPCLRKLIPIVQQAQVDMMARPQATIRTVVRLCDEFKASTPTTTEGEAFAVRQMRELGLVGNGGDATMGNFDTARVQRLIDITRPIFTARRQPIKADLTPNDVVSNEFIDPTIGLAG
jgi:hypothetical protein